MESTGKQKKNNLTKKKESLILSKTNSRADFFASASGRSDLQWSESEREGNCAMGWGFPCAKQRKPIPEGFHSLANSLADGNAGTYARAHIQWEIIV